MSERKTIYLCLAQTVVDGFTPLDTQPIEMF